MATRLWTTTPYDGRRRHPVAVPDPLSPAAALVRCPQGVLSHETAARELGLELVTPRAGETLTVPRSHGHVRLPGWRVRRVDLAGEDVLERDDGVRLTSVTRTVADLSRRLPVGEAVACADSALRARAVTVPELVAALQRQEGPGSARCRRVAALLDPASGSVLESLLRVLLRSELAGEPPLTQHPVLDRSGRLAARVDFCWPRSRLVVEADGFAFHSDRQAYRSDRARLNALASLGWLVLRFTWEDVVHRPGYVVALVTECLRFAA